MSRTKKHEQLPQLSIADAQEIDEQIDTADAEDIQHWSETLFGRIKKLEQSMETAQEEMLDEDKPLEEVKQGTTKQKASLKRISDVRSKLKVIMTGKDRENRQEKLDLEAEKQRIIQQEIRKARMEEQREIDEAIERRIQREEEWVKKKIDMEAAAHKTSNSATNSTSTVKLQKYIITPFEGDYKDWIRFWNQFSVEVDGSTISAISKFNYLLELTRGKPRDDILGLPHTDDGYEEAKRILRSTYGKDIKVHKALVKELENLHIITSVHKTNSVHEFYNKLSRVVRTLATMKKLDSVQSMVYTLMEKLGPVQRILTQSDDDWEEWKLEDLTENLRKYVERTPTQEAEERTGKLHHRAQKDKLLMGNNRQQQTNRSQRECVYCGNDQHRSSNCDRFLTVAGRREFLKKNRLCFNCTATGHTASNCRSRNCFKCDQKHHTSICEKTTTTIPDNNNTNGKVAPEKSLRASMSTGTTLHAMIKATINEQEVRIMIDTGASSSYICSDLVTTLGLQPVHKERRCIEQMYGTVTKVVEIYEVKIDSLAIEGFSLMVDCINAEKDILTYLPNPNIKVIKQQQQRLRRIPFLDENTVENQLPIHVIMGAADYQRIRSTKPPLLGNNPDRDPGAEFTMLGWILYGRMVTTEVGNEKVFFTRSGQKDFEQLCSVDVLGLREEQSQDECFHQVFQEQLRHTPQGFYETRLPWKANKPDLPSNKDLATARLQSTTKRLEKLGRLKDYDEIMQGQLMEGIIEAVPEHPTGEVVHYVPHQAVIRDEAESTKLRIVYDCSAKLDVNQASLNDCLETGPSLQPLLFDILLRNRMRYYCLIGDIKKAFLQIRIRDKDRDALRILWYDSILTRQRKEYRFTRAIFSAGLSPYILTATIAKHVTQYISDFPKTVNDLLTDTYVDDIQSGGDSVQELENFKEEATTIMREGGFDLHKWHSNVRHLETTDNSQEEVKNLGIPWNKKDDTITVEFQRCTQLTEPITKRKILSAINGIYDLLGLASPVTVTGKILFSELCINDVSWDEAVPDVIRKQWEIWVEALRRKGNITVPRTVIKKGIQEVILHGFADASKLATCAAIYAICKDEMGGVKQTLLMAKSRIASRNLTIPRLELVALHTLAKLLNHVKTTLSAYIVTEIHMWSDSMATLYWMANRGTWSKYVRNRVKAIKDLGAFPCHFVPTDQNPSDLGTRGVAPSKLNDFWFEGPQWLSTTSAWPIQPQITETTEAMTERLPRKKDITMLGREDDSEHKEWRSSMIERYNYTKLLRVTGYIQRFATNCKEANKLSGALTTQEITRAEMTWIKLAQANVEDSKDFQVKRDESGVLRCYGQVPNYHPIYIPTDHPLAKKIVERCHQLTLHGGVQTTMSKVRERYWITRLRRMAKSMKHKCNRCKRTSAKGQPAPPPSTLPDFRSKISEPFTTTGVDFAGPLYYKAMNKQIKKAYIALFTCATTRAVHLKLCEDLTSGCFKRAMKEFVARRGCPKLMVSDNAKTFKNMSKWLDTVKTNDDILQYCASQNIQWKFNLSRAPWWGGFFERLIGMTKVALSKTIGQALLNFHELEETLLDIECLMNNRPLTYLNEEFERGPITPSNQR